MRVGAIVAILSTLPALAVPGRADTSAAKGAGAGADDRPATVHFQNADNQPIGEATLRPMPNGLLVDVRLRDLPPGELGFHVHAVGKCQPPFESAGGHFNPTGDAHGFADPKGPHAGDMPNLVVPESGSVQAQFFLDDVTLSGGRQALLDDDGAALVVHAGADDHRTDPAGDSGKRIACGVVERPGTAARTGEPRVAERPDRTPAEDVPGDAADAVGDAAGDAARGVPGAVQRQPTVPDAAAVR